MPLIRYTFRHAEGHELTETASFPRKHDVQATLPEGSVLLKHEVLNPFVHESHEWVKLTRLGDRIFYRCAKCGCEAYNVFNMFHGEQFYFVREGKWKANKYEECRDPLKEMPKATSLFR